MIIQMNNASHNVNTFHLTTATVVRAMYVIARLRVLMPITSPPTRPDTRVEDMNKPDAWARAPRYLIQVDHTQKMCSVLAFRPTPRHHIDVSTSDSGASHLAGAPPHPQHPGEGLGALQPTTPTNTRRLCVGGTKIQCNWGKAKSCG